VVAVASGTVFISPRPWY